MEPKQNPKIINEQSQKVTQHDIFSVVERDDVTFIALGNTIISEKKFANTKEAINYINQKPYELIINASCFAIEQHLKSQKHETK